MNIALKIVGILGIIGLPFGLIEGMWSEPSMRDFARKFDGSVAMWASFVVYYSVLAMIWLRKLSRDANRDGGNLGPKDK